jgi:hypothetical protein
MAFYWRISLKGLTGTVRVGDKYRNIQPLNDKFTSNTRELKTLYDAGQCDCILDIRKKKWAFCGKFKI